MDAERFLFNTISILATSADLRTTIDNLARLAAAKLAEYCTVFMFENEQTVRRMTVVQRTEAGVEAQDVDALFPLDLHSAAGPGNVLRTGECQILNRVTSEILSELAVETDASNVSIYVCVPIVARGHTIGAMAFVSTEPHKTIGASDLSLMTGVANAAAVAINNTKLYREAEEANRLKDEFVATVSHELRTPLTPILGGIHLLRMTKPSEATFERALDIIERHAHTQVQIVEDLLDASRIVSGKLHLVMKTTNVRPVVEAAVGSVRASAEAKRIAVITNFEEMPLPIDGDAHRLQQIIWHLLSNAIKFTPSEGRIEISARPDGEHVEIQITDTGVGIPADILPSIFDRFRKTLDANSKMRTGLGLGLAIVRHLVELHNGSIHAASAGPGRGAVFTLRFPFAARKAASATS
jgi:signal transduction histidine kinase